jgi:cysteinyl-tRNA synthetase
MPLRLFNTLTKSKDVFDPIDAKNVRMYVCGPTVYDFAHIGNARPAIVFDVLFRLLRHEFGAGHVTYVRNITDVDDKINARALRDFPGLPLNEAIRKVTEKTEQQYHADVDALGCRRPTREPRATEHIEGMIAMIQTLLDKDYAYVAQGEEGREALFDVRRMEEYGQLSGRKLEDQLAGARVEAKDYKRNPGDFVLWKESDSNEPGWDATFRISDANREQLQFNSNTIGIRGRPGWHIECSVMSKAFLGETFDIHGGGLDLIFPHHENEIAQSRCAHGTHAMANTWMHNGFLQVEGEKMSKSLGNFFTIRELLNEYPGGALRFAMLQTHYRQPINWTKSKVVEAWGELQDWAALIYGSRAEHDMNLRKAEKKSAIPHPAIIEALGDDLNTSEAITSLRDLFKRHQDEAAYAALIESCEFLGLFEPKTIGAYETGVGGTNLGADRIFALHDAATALRVAYINQDTQRQIEIEKLIAAQGVGADISYYGHLSFNPLKDVSPFEGGAIQRLIAARNAARAAKNFAESDRIRDELLAKGIVLKDGPQGTTWEVKR